MSASSSTSLLHHLTKWRRFWRGRGYATSSGIAKHGIPLDPPTKSRASGERAPDGHRSPHFRKGRRAQALGEGGAQACGGIERQEASSEVADLNVPVPSALRKTSVPEDGVHLGAQEGDVFVGRQRELAELEAGLGDALAGRGRVFLIGGEAGIGKTRLVDELASRARDRGARVLWGRCWEAGGAPAYWPWVQALRSYVRDQDPETLLVQLGSGAPDIAQVLPELRDQFPEVRVSASSDPEGARFRLFDSTVAFLRIAAGVQPLVLVLDDLQAADAPSLLLLRFVASEIDDTHLLLVGLYRDDGPENPHLTSTVAEVARHMATRQTSLAGLERPDVAALIQATVDVQVPPAVIEAVQGQTEGNPLYVNEVIRLLVAEGRLEDTDEATLARAEIPARIREVIGRRLG